MPPLPSPGNVLRLHARFGPSDSNQWGIRNYFTYSGGAPTGTECTAAATQWFSEIQSNIMPLVDSNIFLTEATVIDLSSDTGNEGVHSGSQAGGDSSGKVPEDVCAVIGHTIGRRYRGGKPKTFLPPGGEGALADLKSWTSDFTSALDAAWGSMIADFLAFTTGGLSLVNIVNVSYYHGFTVFTTPSGRARNIPTPRATPVVDDITGHTVNGTVGSQRRRRFASTG
jgi:hypothetical protein